MTPEGFRTLQEDLESRESKSLLTKIAGMIRDLADKGVETASKTLSEIERAFVRVYRSSADKMAEFSEYAETRAKSVLAAIDRAGDKVPDYLRAGVEKAREYFKNPNSSVDKVRVGATIAAGVLAIGNIWVELDKRDYETDRVVAYLKESAKEAVDSLPYAGAIMLANMTPLGPAVMFTLGAVTTYAAIRNITHYMATEAGLDPNGITYKIVKAIDDSLAKFENTVKSYIDWAGEQLKTAAETVLEQVSGRAIEWLSEEAAGWVGEKNDILIGDDVSLLVGSEQSNWLIHRSAGEVYGEKGDDVLVGWLPEVIRSGDAIGGIWYEENGERKYRTAREVREAEAAAQALYEQNKRSGVTDEHNPKPEPTPGVQRAEQEYTLKLDGGAGDDWVVTILGEKAITIGGAGRDWIYNSSNGGVIYGDTVDGLDPDTGAKVEDSAANADNIWYSANTTVMDAQHHDVLKFYGLTLTGGNAEGGIAGLAAFGGVGAVAGLANFFSSLDENGKYDPARTVYFDHLFPWMTYVFRPNGDGGLDMYLTNQFDQLFTAVLGDGSSDAYKAQQALDAEGNLNGWMKIKNFDLVGSFIGSRQAELDGQGTFNMVFKAVNPLADLMALLNPLLGGAIGMGLAATYGGMALVDQALTLSAAATRFAKGMAWAEGAYPLIIDLDGDGIETTELSTSTVYFDLDGDLFAERAGWVAGDDGFLVRDANANGNGRIDSIAEMFGGVGASGFAQLSEFDSNHDGKITRADALWADLKIWQDKDRDGITDAGELKSLDDLKITTLDLGSTALGVTTPQGAHLTAVGNITFESGTVSHMFDAVLSSSEVDTKFAGESGRTDWQSALTLDAKGFGRVTNLSIAMANDIALGQLAMATAASMTTPNLRDLVAKVGGLLGAWGEALEEMRELTPVLVGRDGAGKARAARPGRLRGGRPGRLLDARLRCVRARHPRPCDRPRHLAGRAGAGRRFRRNLAH